MGVVRSRKWKLIGKYELYDLENDPGEKHNVISEYPEIAAEYLQKLNDFIHNTWGFVTKKKNKVKKSKISVDEKSLLKKYGYW